MYYKSTSGSTTTYYKEHGFTLVQIVKSEMLDGVEWSMNTWNDADMMIVDFDGIDRCSRLEFNRVLLEASDFLMSLI